MTRPTPFIVLLCASLCLPGLAGAAPTDTTRTVCGAWALPIAAAGCGEVKITWGGPSCAGTGATYACTVLFEESWSITGTGCVFTDVDQYGNGWSGLCSSGHAWGSLGPVPVTYANIPAGGLVVTVTTTACFSADNGGFNPVAGSSSCTSWVVGTVELPEE